MPSFAAAATTAAYAMFPFWSVVSMLSNVATRSAGPWLFRTLARTCTRPHGAANVDARDTRRRGGALARGGLLHAAWFRVERPVPRGSRAHTGRPQPRRHATEHRRDDLQTRLDEDDPAADRLHECAEA